MTIEESVFTTLRGLCSDRVYPVEAPNKPGGKYIVYQMIPGGQAPNFLEAATVGLRNGIFQLNCWGSTSAEAMALARAAEDAMVLAKATLKTTVLGGISTLPFDTAARLYGATQDFSVWY